MKVGLIGKMCSGKTYVSCVLSRRCALKKFAFADKVKEIAVDLFGMEKKDRKLLQQIGQSMRDIDENVWINYLIKSTKNKDRIIIDDIRYPNELETLKKNGFTIIKLVIDDKTQEERIMSTYPEMYEQHLNNRNHKSEIYIDSMKADYEIVSDENVIENILKSIDPYYGKSIPSSAIISSSWFS
jgi:dephospho-CoA kinase